jgi:hypothetical protein
MNSKLKSYTVIVITLVLGIVIGALSFRAVSIHCLMGPPPGPGMLSMGKIGPGAFLAERMRCKLNLSDKQYRDVKAIINTHEGNIKEAMISHHSMMMTLMDSLELELKPVLTEEQAAVLEKLKQKRGPGKPGWAGFGPDSMRRCPGPHQGMGMGRHGRW